MSKILMKRVNKTKKISCLLTNNHYPLLKDNNPKAGHLTQNKICNHKNNYNLFKKRCNKRILMINNSKILVLRNNKNCKWLKKAVINNKDNNNNNCNQLVISNKVPVDKNNINNHNLELQIFLTIWEINSSALLIKINKFFHNKMVIIFLLLFYTYKFLSK